jgi:4-aminobutyrate--pyruvate transaminase
MSTAKLRGATALEGQDLEHVLHPNTNLAALHQAGPTVFTRAQGIRVWDDRGREYIEGMAGLWCTTLGYGDEELARTAYEQIKKLSFSHMFAGRSHEPGIRLADKLASMAPFKDARVFFGNSGSDGNDTQVKLVRYYNNAVGRPGKKKIVARERAYHGTTIAAGSLTGLPAFHAGFDLPIPGILHAECPNFYRGAEAGETEDAYADRLAGMLERLILREGPDTVAAMIAEPLMGVGGVLLPPAGYFQKIQAVLDRYDILMIDDEVICGFGRCGNLWGAETFRMKPTTMTVAKALSSAYLPISAVIVPEFMYEPMVEASGEVGLFGHGFTYSGHPVSAAVALKTLEIYEERKLYEHVRRLTPRFQSRLQGFAAHPLVGEARGIGLLGACELVRDKESKEAFDAKLAVGAKCMAFCQQHGLIVRAIGDAVAVCPPYIVTERDVDDIFDRYAQGLDDTYAWAKQERILA